MTAAQVFEDVEQLNFWPNDRPLWPTQLLLPPGGRQGKEAAPQAPRRTGLV